MLEKQPEEDNQAEMCKKKMKNISEKIWRGMKKSVLLHSLNENKGVGKEAIFESNSIKLFVEKYKEDIKP